MSALIVLVGCGVEDGITGTEDSSSGSLTDTSTVTLTPGTTVSMTTLPGSVDSTTVGLGMTSGQSTGPAGTTAMGGSSTEAGVSTTTGGSTGGTTTVGVGTTTGPGSSSSSSSSSGSSSSDGGPVCGNGAIDAGEQCDGADLQGFTCALLGLGGGELACDPATCIFDTAGCMPEGDCGNGAVDPGEQCDGADLQGFDCASLGLGGGALGCDPVMCTFDTSMCMPDGGGTTG